MNAKHIALVQSSFEQVIPIGEAAAQLFYNRLFELDPDLRPLFRDDLQEQGRKLMAMLTVAVRHLGRLDEIAPALAALAQRHAGYGVRVEDYTTVASALLWTLEQGLGESFTPAVRAAWIEAYGLLAAAMHAPPAHAAARTSIGGHV
jgi:hemoglobin-like flavoprotein